MTEKVLQRKIRDYFIRHGNIVIKLTMLGKYGSAGWPDLLILQPEARILFIEVKSAKGRLTPLQARCHQRLRAFGFLVFIIRSMDDLCELEARGW